MTDDLDEPALRPFASEARSGVLATRAGVDILLYAQGYETGVAAAAELQRAVAAGEVTRAALERSARLVLALRRTLSG